MRRPCFSLYRAALLVLKLLLLRGLGGGGVAAAISREDFPQGFIFGAGISAYQAEGAAAEDGRKPSIWDTFAHRGLNQDHSAGDVAADQYHKYKEDVKLMHDMGLDAYRFSISWPRLIPDGKGPVNPKGLQYYNNLIDELVSHGIEPHVTLYHFDLPQALQDEYEGLLNPRIIEDFTAYADVCFREFGDRVKHWMTFNEPNLEPVIGYDVGIFPPGRCSSPFGFNCTVGDSTREPYLAAHHVLLSHASAVTLYRDKYQAEQGGKIGITLLGFWFEPFTSSQEDIIATSRTRDFHIGWFMDPLVHGDYPATMKELVASRLPSFSESESKKLKASFDFIGINHYCVFYLLSYPNHLDKNRRDYIMDLSVTVPNFPTVSRGKVFALRGPPPFPSTPWALQKLLEYLKVQYGNPPVMIHENGYADFSVAPASEKGVEDDERIKFLHDYMEGMLQSIRNGSNVCGYFVWSFIDCFELMFGYTARYGLIGVDFSRAERSRFPRLSAQWYSDFLRNGGLRTSTSKLVQSQ